MKPYVIQSGFHHHYKILGQLGEGAAGQVYKGARNSLDQGIISPVAVKVLNKKRQSEFSHYPVRDLHSEIRAHWALSQSGSTIKLLEIFEDDIDVFLVLEYADKGTLYDATMSKG